MKGEPGKPEEKVPQVSSVRRALQATTQKVVAKLPQAIARPVSKARDDKAESLKAKFPEPKRPQAREDHPEPLIAAKAKANQVASGGAVPKKSAEPMETRQEIAKAADVSHDTVAQLPPTATATA